MLYTIQDHILAEVGRALPPTKTPILTAFLHPPDHSVEALHSETDEKAKTKKGIRKITILNVHKSLLYFSKEIK